VTTPLRFRHAASLAEHASFRRAAATLRISQPALTKSIQALEADLGVQLFERRRSGVVLTAFGRLVVEHARGSAHADRELLRQIQLVAGLETGSLKVAFGPFPSVMSVYPATASLLAKHPNIHVSLQSADWREVVQSVVEQKADLGIAEMSTTSFDDALHAESIGTHRAHFLCRAGHPILREARITRTQLLQHPWATTRLPPRMAASFPRATGRAGYIDTRSGDFIPAVDLSAPGSLGLLVARSEVLGLGPLTLVEPELKNGSVVIVPTEEVSLRGGYGLTYLKSRPPSPAALAFIAEIRAHEKLLVKNEARLERLYGHAQRQPPT
jgi:DNA-binding transcriptional LysR family regulator